jgi:hypothetical protein
MPCVHVVVLVYRETEQTHRLFFWMKFIPLCGDIYMYIYVYIAFEHNSFFVYISNATCFGLSYGPSWSLKYIYEAQVSMHINIVNLRGYKFYNTIYNFFRIKLLLLIYMAIHFEE